LFVPVSGEFGLGEYARSLAIAHGAEGRWPGASIRFLLSREAPYADTTPFATTLLDSSPTFHSAAVIDVMQSWRPDVVIFDNAGRTAQLRAAKRCGARVVYISARRRQRHKAFRLRWMRLIDEHWIAYPRFIAGDLKFLERFKLKVMRRPQVRFLDVILARDGGAHEARESILARLHCVPDQYTLVVPGGGTGHPRASDAVARFLQAAGELAAAGVDTVFVGPAVPAFAGSPPAESPARGATAADSRLRMTGPLPQSDLAALMRGARLIIANGGSTLLQSIACGKPCIAVPIAGDQSERIRRCVSAGVAVAAPLDAAAIRKSASDLLQNAQALNALAGRAIGLGLADGVAVALRAMTRLLESK
jgi:UDP-N-acetylglucosamine:LPS N-acetylglucosamine transferase